MAQIPRDIENVPSASSSAAASVKRPRVCSGCMPCCADFVPLASRLVSIMQRGVDNANLCPACKAIIDALLQVANRDLMNPGPVYENGNYGGNRNKRTKKKQTKALVVAAPTAATIRRKAREATIARTLAGAGNAVRGLGMYGKNNKIWPLLAGCRRPPITGPFPINGRGGFWGDLWNAGKKYVPRLIGGGLGLLAGNPRMGWTIGGAVSHLLGWGSYASRDSPWTVKGNTVMTNGGQGMSFSTNGEGDVVITCREFLFDVYSTTTFNCNSYALNPGLDATYPWLWGIAQNFESYDCFGEVWEYEPLASESLAAFGSLGSVMMAMNMNPLAVTPYNEGMIEQMKFHCSAKCSQPLFAPLECSPAEGAKTIAQAIRIGPIPSGGSLNDYDHGVMFVATNGMPSAGICIGKVFSAYHYVFHGKTSLGQGSNMNMAIYNITGAAKDAYLGTAQTKVCDSIGLTFPNDANGRQTITFPLGYAGATLFMYNVAGTAATIGNMYTLVTSTNSYWNMGYLQQSGNVSSVIAGTNSLFPSYSSTFSGYNNTWQSPLSGVSSATVAFAMVETMTDPTHVGYLSLGKSGDNDPVIPTSPTMAQLIVMQLYNNI